MLTRSCLTHLSRGMIIGLYLRCSDRGSVVRLVGCALLWRCGSAGVLHVSRFRQDPGPEGLNSDNMANACRLDKNLDPLLSRDSPFETVGPDGLRRQPVHASIRLVALDELDDPATN